MGKWDVHFLFCQCCVGHTFIVYTVVNFKVDSVTLLALCIIIYWMLSVGQNILGF